MATGLSRVNDGDHYASQALLGWWLAMRAADAVDRTQDASRCWSIVPYPDPQTTGFGVQLAY
ncbi:MAG: hypothetical protein O3A00_02900 [Planctomycetota bacterium]|nr:hypothetical protein [Planctomycetota bacterium]